MPLRDTEEKSELPTKKHEIHLKFSMFLKILCGLVFPI